MKGYQSQFPFRTSTAMGMSPTSWSVSSKTTQCPRVSAPTTTLWNCNAVSHKQHINININIHTYVTVCKNKLIMVHVCFRLN